MQYVPDIGEQHVTAEHNGRGWKWVSPDIYSTPFSRCGILTWGPLSSGICSGKGDWVKCSCIGPTWSSGVEVVECCNLIQCMDVIVHGLAIVCCHNLSTWWDTQGCTSRYSYWGPSRPQIPHYPWPGLVEVVVLLAYLEWGHPSQGRVSQLGTPDGGICKGTLRLRRSLRLEGGIRSI